MQSKNQTLQSSPWFGAWFDSPYYHILYRHRDHQEAQFFINRLAFYLNFDSDDRILDLACGKGRHAIYLNKKGFDVVGIDLAPQNIRFAKKFENPRLRFEVHDMRLPFPDEKFDYILNLFTSFGYFDRPGENQQTINAMAENLWKGGKLVLDFLNTFAVVNSLVAEEFKIVNDIKFQIRKIMEGEFIVKDIRIEDDGKIHHFREKLKAITRSRFLEYFKCAGFTVLDQFGDYNLNPYVAEKSERMIFILRK